MICGLIVGGATQKFSVISLIVVTDASKAAVPRDAVFYEAELSVGELACFALAALPFVDFRLLERKSFLQMLTTGWLGESSLCKSFRIICSLI